MAKIYKSKFYQPYMKERRRIQSAIYRIKKAGYFVNFSLPSIPKKITEASIRRLSQITPKYIREQSVYVTPEGKQVSAQIEQNKRRIESAKRGGKTRKQNRQSYYDYFAYGITHKRLDKQEESKLPKNIQWYEAGRTYVNFATGEIIPDIDAFVKSVPDQMPIVMNNYLKETGEKILPTDVFNELLESLENTPDDSESWYRRKSNARSKSVEVRQKLASKIHSIIRNKQANKVYYKNIVEAGRKDELMQAIEKATYGYGEDDVTSGYSLALQILTGGEYALSAAEYEDADEEFE